MDAKKHDKQSRYLRHGAHGQRRVRPLNLRPDNRLDRNHDLPGKFSAQGHCPLIIQIHRGTNRRVVCHRRLVILRNPANQVGATQAIRRATLRPRRHPATKTVRLQFIRVTRSVRVLKKGTVRDLQQHRSKETREIGSMGDNRKVSTSPGRLTLCDRMRVGGLVLYSGWP